jgi:hypothetical protein
LKFHDDVNQAFQPLKEFVSDFMEEEDAEGTLNQYMYMFHDEEQTHYKHFGSRKYFKINNDGTSEGKLENWRKWND